MTAPVSPVAQESDRKTSQTMAEQVGASLLAERAAANMAGTSPQSLSEAGIDVHKISDEALKQAQPAGHGEKSANVSALKDALRNLMDNHLKNQQAQHAGDGNQQQKTKTKVSFQPLCNRDDILGAGQPMGRIQTRQVTDPNAGKGQGSQPQQQGPKQVQPMGGAASSATHGSGGGGSTAPAGASAATSKDGKDPNKKDQPEGDPQELEQVTAMQQKMAQAGANTGGTGMSLVNPQTGQSVPIPAGGSEIRANTTNRIAFAAPPQELSGRGGTLLAWENLEKGKDSKFYLSVDRSSAGEMLGQHEPNAKKNPSDESLQELVKHMSRAAEPG